MVFPATDNQEANLGKLRLVGIGASAGGLEALRELMAVLPDFTQESGPLSYVIAQHVSPTHVSLLMGLLAPLTTLRVQELEDDTTPEAGVVYITPPNKDVVLEQGLLRLREPAAAIGPKPSVNHFFHSLAEELGELAIGIILSGTGTDGASGIRAIKAAGGITIAQEPGSAKYDGMPKAAIHTGSVDLILVPSQIGPVLERLLSQPGILPNMLDDNADSDEYTQINNLVRVAAAFRLDDYKKPTVHRRIARRMSIVGTSSLADYVTYMREHRDEAAQLMRDTFISVTSFFRDSVAFNALEQTIADIVSSRNREDVIRCWVPACATGEEVYSIAMLFEEALRNKQSPSAQYMIFASDMDEAALEVARGALYSRSELESIPAALRQRYMDEVGDHYRIIKSVRNRIVFTRQNVIEDPPFSRLDLVSCRNLLIYFVPSVQKRVIEIFHYALNPGGYLFLGRSESVDNQMGLFSAFNGQMRIYKRMDGDFRYTNPMSSGATQGGNDGSKRHFSNTRSSVDGVTMLTLEWLASRYAPPSLVINEDDIIIHMQGDLKPFLGFPQGRVDMYIFDLVEQSIRAELRALIYRCRRDLLPLQSSSRPFQIDGQAFNVATLISPLEQGNKALLLISFLATASKESGQVCHEGEDLDRDSLIISELEKELANTRTHLNVVVEELETSNEELQSLNEELQSTNEELQSTNEELQTSNEELQSTNEELLTVNEELQVKSAELETVAGDLTNVKESLHFPLLVVNAELTITQANQACSDVLVHHAPLEGCSLSSIQWLPELNGLISQVRQVIREGAPYSSHVRDNESGRIYEFHIIPYLVDRQKVSGAILLFEDRSAQFKAEEDLRESERRFRQVVESLPQLVWTCEPEGPCDYLSPQWLAFTGIGEAEQLGFGWLDQIHPDDRQRTIEHWQATAAQGAYFEIEFRLRRHDGEYLWFRTQAKPLRNIDGKIIKWFGSNTNIDAFKRAEQALYASEERFRLMVENLKGYAIIFLDTFGNIQLWNQGAARLSGYQAEEVIGKHFSILYAPDEISAGVPARLLDLARAQGSEEHEGWHLHKDGRSFIADVSVVSIINNETGLLIGFAKISRDITKRKEQEKKLLDAKLAAERANVAKAAFLANMSHEIRTPLNGILGMAYLINREGLTAKQTEYLANLKASSDHLLHIINAILDLSKIEAGKFGLEESRFVPGVVIDNVEAMLRDQLQKKGLTWNVEIDTLPDDLLADETKIQQAILNYASNAVKFTEVGGVTLAIKKEEVSPDNALIRFEVRDTGVGIEASVLPRLFTAFEQADNSTTRKYGGTGLGLAITRRLANLMGGEAGVESTPGVGSNFWFTARLKRGSLSGSESEINVQANPEELLKQKFAGSRILLVEDDPVNAEIGLLLINEGLGMKVDLAKNGVEAVRLAKEKVYAAILMDMQMPIMGGIEATRQIRQTDLNKRTPILAMTANAFAEDRKACLDAGMNDHIPKPFEPSQINLKLLYWLSKKD